MSKCASRSRSMAALLAACTRSPGCSAFTARAQLVNVGELPLEEAVVVEIVGGGEVRHRPGQLHPAGVPRRGQHARCLGRVARAEPSHAGVELDVHPAPAGGRDRLDVALVPDHHVRVGRERLLQLSRAERSHHQHAHAPQIGLAQLARLLRAGHRQPARAAGERGPRALAPRRDRSRRPSPPRTAPRPSRSSARRRAQLRSIAATFTLACARALGHAPRRHPRGVSAPRRSVTPARARGQRGDHVGGDHALGGALPARRLRGPRRRAATRPRRPPRTRRDPARAAPRSRP